MSKTRAIASFISGVVSTRSALGSADPRAALPKIPKLTHRSQPTATTSAIPSHTATPKPDAYCTASPTAKQAPKTYTGTAMLGVATMHKSNSVPVFSKQDAIDIAKMRRN